MKLCGGHGWLMNGRQTELKWLSRVCAPSMLVEWHHPLLVEYLVVKRRPTDTAVEVHEMWDSVEWNCNYLTKWGRFIAVDRLTTIHLGSRELICFNRSHQRCSGASNIPVASFLGVNSLLLGSRAIRLNRKICRAIWKSNISCNIGRYERM